ncbi:YybH family protein [Rhodohalobacter halophilus]|uniref:YybH family protein n=1 Tax=Rhodohalobacter halophilus TaxID=1812810 RepID=UPI00083FA163|nr:SgcJ/EcaC family oxidoreductase [Rhodohalobacter halophilus]
MKVLSTLFTVSVFGFAALTSCTNQSAGSAAPENPEGELRELWNQFTQNWKASDAEASVSIYQADALNIPNNYKTNSGREEIREFYQFLFDNHQPVDYRHRTESIYFNGDVAVEFATFRAEWISNEGEEWSYDARALIHWKKDPDGGWRIQTMLFNNPPEEESQP